nr:MAG TPA: hypothetical protein [Caudoviricetes sp.]
MLSLKNKYFSFTVIIQLPLSCFLHKKITAKLITVIIVFILTFFQNML